MPQLITAASPDDAARVLGALHYGLYLLTCGTAAEPAGMLVSWVSQVSGQPPLVMVAVRHNRALLPALERRGVFALNLLPAGDRALAADLGRPRQKRFEGLEIVEGARGLPYLGAALGAAACRVREVWRPGDHALLVGEVVDAKWRGPGAALSCASLGGAPYLGLS